MVDLDSALVCYRVKDGKATAVPELADKDKLETYPAWSPDGKYLYYCSAPILWKDRNAVPPENYDKVKYDLRRISYDAADGPLGTGRDHPLGRRDRPEHPVAAGVARRPVPALLHVPLRLFPGLPAQQRPVPHGL